MSGTETEPLLEVVADGKENDDGHINIQTLIEDDPTNVVNYISSKGLKKLGTFGVKDDVLLRALNGRPMLTYGSDSPDIDYEQEWREILFKSAPEYKGSWGARLKVSAYVVTIKDASSPDVKGLLHPLLKRWQGRSLSDKVFSLPAVTAVINFKWDWFAYRLLLIELAFFLLWLLSFNVFTFLFQDEDLTLTLSQLLSTTKGKIELGMEVLALVGMLPFLIIEASTIYVYKWGWFSAWNLLDIATYANQIALTVMHLDRTYVATEVMTVSMAAQAIMLWFRLQYFSRVFRPTRFAFLDALTAVVELTKWYFLFSLFILWGFGQAFYILYRLDQNKTDEFDGLGSTMLTMFKWMLSGADLDLVSKASSPGVTMSVTVLFQFVMSMVLLNLLIGVMMNAVTKVDESGTVLHYVSKAQVIDELESTLPAWMERLLGIWVPHYVHILKLDTTDKDIELLLGEDDRYAIEEAEEDEEGDEGEDGGEDADDTGSTTQAKEGDKGEGEVSASVVQELRELKNLVLELQAQLEAVSNAVTAGKTKSSRWL